MPTKNNAPVTYGVPVNYNEGCVCEKVPTTAALDETLCHSFDIAREIEYQVNALSFKLFGDVAPQQGDDPKPMCISDFVRMQKEVLERTLSTIHAVRERLGGSSV